MAPLMRTCCCYRDMRLACQSAAIFVIIIAGISLLWGIINIVSIGLFSNLYTLAVVELVFEVILLIIGILLLVGSRKGYAGRKLILAFVVLMPFYLLFDIGTQIAGYILISNLYVHFPWTFQIVLNLLFWLARIVVFILGELAAISLYQILMEEGPNGPPHPQVIHQPQQVNMMSTGYPVGYPPAQNVVQTNQYPTGPYPPPQPYPGVYPPPQSYPGVYPPPQSYPGDYPPPQHGVPPPPYPESQYSKHGPPQ